MYESIRKPSAKKRSKKAKNKAVKSKHSINNMPISDKSDTKAVQKGLMR